MISGCRYIARVSIYIMLFFAIFQNGYTQSFVFKGQAIGWAVASQMEELVGLPGSGDTKRYGEGRRG